MQAQPHPSQFLSLREIGYRVNYHSCPIQDEPERAGIRGFRFHDLRHTFAFWYMMNGGDLYELAKILGHSNIKMTERYAKPGRQRIARTGNTAREIWKLMEKEEGGKAHIG